MAQQKTASKGGRTCGVIAAMSVFLLLVIVAGSTACNFFSGSPGAAQAPIVRILNPTNGSTSELNQPVQVSATASDSAGVMRVELYADGALAAVQETTLAQGSNPLIFKRDWAPLTTGTHILLARAYNRTGNFADSNVVRMDVVDLLTKNMKVNVDDLQRGPNVPIPSLNQISQVSQVPLDRLRDANPQLRNTDANVPLPGGTDLNIPRSPAPAPSPLPGGGTPGGGTAVGLLSPQPGVPRAPTGLTGTGDCASVQLSWAGSVDAEHYVVYRLDPGATNLSPVAPNLPANTVSYRDTLPVPGTYFYFVAAVRGRLEGLSTMFTFAAPCQTMAPPPNTMNLLITFISVELPSRYEGVFCYGSINGAPFERVPVYPGELRPDRGAAQTFSFDQEPSHGQMPLPMQAVDQPVTLVVECNGRRGLLAPGLGRAQASHPRADWNGAERVVTSTPSVAGGETFRLRYRIGPDTPEVRQPLWYNAAFDPRTYYGGGLVPNGSVFPCNYVPAPMNLRFEPNGQGACDQTTDAVYLLQCRTAGVPTITWDWNGNESLISGFKVGFPLLPLGLKLRPEQRTALIPWDLWEMIDRAYGSRAQASSVPYIVSVLQGYGDKGLQLEFPFAEGHFTLPPYGPQYYAGSGDAIVEVTLQDLTVLGSPTHDGRIVDNDICEGCVDRRMELYGSFEVSAGGEQDENDVRWWYGNEHHLGVDNGPGGDFGTPFGGCNGFTCLDEQDNYIDFQSTATALDTYQGLMPGRNTMRVRVPEGGTVWVNIRIFDYDYDFSGTTMRVDHFCEERLELEPRFAQDWATVDYNREIIQDNSEAICWLRYRIRGMRH